MDTNQRIKSYVLRTSRMSKGQKRALSELYPKHCIDYKHEIEDFSRFFEGKKLCVEIGFGMGAATAELAEKNPDINYIGIEVHKPGVGRLLMNIEVKNLKNLKIINHDAVEVIENMIADSSVDGFHIFFPDPWHKKKHHKRRLINAGFTKLLTTKLKQGGYIYTATDWEDYANQIYDVFEQTYNIKNVNDKWANNPISRPETAFEAKGKNKNHIIRELFYTKQ